MWFVHVISAFLLLERKEVFLAVACFLTSEEVK